VPAVLVNRVRDDLPELPDDRKRRYLDAGIALADALILSNEHELSDYFDAAAPNAGVDAQTCANWVLVEVVGALKKRDVHIAQSPVSPVQLAALLSRIADGTISGKIAKQVFEAMLEGEGDADAIIEARGLKQITDDGALDGVIEEVLGRSQKQIDQYLSGQEKVFNYFVGQVMAATRGRANPDRVRDLMKEKLEERR
ncbi:MAG: Asp-tRNA(Asn)/Glu-tRNA(Gln) amidotransferase GatCAB subunit B, partial [Pseudomonadota bacterium]